jgi:hypothetical protein
LEHKHKKIQLLEAKHQAQEAALKEEAQQEASTVLALKQQLESYEQTQHKLRSTIREVRSPNSYGKSVNCNSLIAWKPEPGAHGEQPGIEGEAASHGAAVHG